MIDSLVNGNNVGELKERRLKYHINTEAKSKLTRDVNSVNRVEFYVIFSDITLNACGNMLLKLLLAPNAVKQKCSARL